MGECSRRELRDERDAARSLSTVLRARDTRRRNGRISDATISAFFGRGEVIRTLGKFRRPEQVRALLDRHILPRLGARPITEIKRGDLFLFVVGVMDGSANDGCKAPRPAAQLLQYLKRLFAYAVSAGILETNPAEGIKAKEIGLGRKPRSRNLSFPELSVFVRWLWSPECFVSLIDSGQ
jgi:hypothetical protein